MTRVPGHRAPVVLLVCALAAGWSGCRPDQEAEQRSLFRSADVDRDGVLELSEYIALRPVEDPPADAAEEFADADEDGDQRLSDQEFFSTLPTPHRALWVIGVVSAISFVGSIIAIPIVVARLPVDHFVGPHEPADWVTSSVGRRIWLVLKNLLGLLLIAGGLLMLVLPGQGVLTMLLGVAMMDLPGKWKLMRGLARRPNVMKALNWMRERSKKPPLIPPPPKGETHREITMLPPGSRSRDRK